MTATLIMISRQGQRPHENTNDSYSSGLLTGVNIESIDLVYNRLDCHAALTLLAR
jgi:hypothetical protein